MKPEMAKMINFRNSLTLNKHDHKKFDNLNEIISNKEAEENRKIRMVNNIVIVQDANVETVRKLWLLSNFAPNLSNLALFCLLNTFVQFF